MKVTRRQVLGMVGGAVVASAAAGQGGWTAEKGSIRLGYIVPLTGPFSQNGKDMWDGFRLYFEEIGMQAGGRHIELILEDSWVEPAEALTKLRKLAERDKVHLAAGGLLGPTAFALQAYITQQKLPFVAPIMSADDISQRKINPWLVRAGLNGSQSTHRMGEYAYKVLGYRKVAGINFDFTFGHESFGGFQRVFEEHGGQVVQKLWVPAAVADFAPYLALLKRDVDAVFVTFAGASALRFLKQAVEYGIKGKVPIIGQGTLTDEHVLPSMGDEAVGVVTAMNYSAALENPANKKFRAAYGKFAGKTPSHYAAMNYTAARMTVEAIKAVGGDIEDRERFLAAIKKMEIPDDPRGPFRLDSWGSAQQNVYIRKVERVGGQLQNTIIHTYPNVSQFWTYKPDEYLKNPVYDRDKYPGCRFC